jgi:hypothetical protein
VLRGPLKHSRPSGGTLYNIRRPWQKESAGFIGSVAAAHLWSRQLQTMPPRPAKKRLVVDDDDDENASTDTKTTKQARTASTSATRVATHVGGADSAAEEEPRLLRGRAQAPKVNPSWRGGDDRRHVARGNSPSASAEHGELTFLPAFRRGIRLSELSKQRSFYGRTDSIVGGWARPPSERLAVFKSNSNKA